MIRKVSEQNDTNNEDYYFNSEGNVVFTKRYHLKRGYCCKSNCLNCPYVKKNNG